jgi:hypothetical protein
MKLRVIIPCFNEEASLPPLLARLEPIVRVPSVGRRSLAFRKFISSPKERNFSEIICFGMSGDGTPFCFDFRSNTHQPSIIWWDDIYWR